MVQDEIEVPRDVPWRGPTGDDVRALTGDGLALGPLVRQFGEFGDLLRDARGGRREGGQLAPGAVIKLRVGGAVELPVDALAGEETHGLVDHGIGERAGLPLGEGQVGIEFEEGALLVRPPQQRRAGGTAFTSGRGERAQAVGEGEALLQHGRGHCHRRPLFCVAPYGGLA